ncbi:MAG: hypothetical protein LBB94_09665 [Clostridiales bacterium]|jgi:hypothetical protein|nr:hypothetical protein [Clostridiales bacterium]
MIDTYIENMQRQENEELLRIDEYVNLKNKKVCVFGLDNPSYRAERLLLFIGIKIEAYITLDNKKKHRLIRLRTLSQRNSCVTKTAVI